ncbi:MAG: toprim domain-containing protein [Scytonema sp. CRU_2_7]|nr:toprim domain-containing protein [Scytonema sp. CRU_2_7]
MKDFKLDAETLLRKIIEEAKLPETEKNIITKFNRRQLVELYLYISELKKRIQNCQRKYTIYIRSRRLVMTEKLKDHKNLTVFKQHGFIYKGESGKQVYGHSIFSGKDNFWINPESKMWDCKNTGKSGGFQSFLQEVYMLSMTHLTGDKLSWLNKNRGLRRSTILDNSLGYNPSTESYIIPVFDSMRDKIWDLKIFNPKTKKMIGTSGCASGLYGWETLGEAKTVWLCEGEWDRLAMYEILKKMDLLGSTTAVAVPGANTFKTDWATLFEEKDVYVAYDKDDPTTVNGIVRPGAGPQGTLKIKNMLTNKAKTLKFVHWDTSLKDGYDVRDLLIESRSHAGAYKKINSLLKSDIPLPEEFRGEVNDANKSDEELFIGPMIKHTTVYKEYRKWLHLPSTDVLDIMFGTIIANRLDGDPLWMFIVAPSGATKTELLLSISDGPKITSTTTLTPHSLVSGANYAGGGDPSLIPRLNGKVLVIKDFTTILNMNDSARDEIFGIFRDAFDGKTEKMFGNGVHRSYKSKFGIVSGVTPAIDMYAEGQTALGERFLRYRIPISSAHKDRFEYLSRAMSNVNSESKMKENLSSIGTSVLRYNYASVPSIPSDISRKLMILAQWTSILRSTIIRDKYSKELQTLPFTELGTRLVKQFTKLIMGISLFRGRDSATISEFMLVRDVSVGSIASDLNLICKFLYKTKKMQYADKSEISLKTGIPIESCRRKLENLMMINVIEKRKVGNSLHYKIHDEIKFLFDEGEIYE